MENILNKLKLALAAPERLHINGNDGKIYTGGSQEWYSDSWHRKAGCAPTVASNIILYAMEQPEHSRKNCGQDNFIELMDEMIAFITPGMRGVNTSAMFYGGFVRYGEKHGVKFVPRVMEIPCAASKRPAPGAVREFIAEALRADSPVAFLNLSNGTLENLEGWHWVTIIAFEPGSMAADICDQGDIFTIDLGQWLQTTVLGGALVYMRI
jgi:hypothetical protein